MLNKTKAAMPGRQWYTSKRIENDISIVIDQVNACSFAHISFNYGKSPEVTAAMPRFLSEGVRHWRSAQSPNFSGDLQSAENSADPWLAEKPADRRGWLRLEAQISTKGISSLEQNQRVKWYVLSSAFRFRRRSISACSAAMMNCDVLSSRFLNNSISSTILCGTLACNFWDLELMFVVLTTEFSLVVPITDDTAAERAQPFGSMPRDCSSLRKMRFIQVARDESPSFRISSSSCERNSSFKRMGNCGDLFSGIDMVYAIGDIKRVYTSVYAMVVEKQRPGVVETLPKRLTKPLIEVTVMADIQSTQTHPKFTWRFLALSASARNVIHITAATEREARDQSPAGCVMVFAGRLPVQGVSHA